MYANVGMENIQVLLEKTTYEIYVWDQTVKFAISNRTSYQFTQLYSTLEVLIEG